MTHETAVPVRRPPRWAEKFAAFFIAARDRDAIRGDLLEEYREVVLPSKGPLGADLWYLGQALSLALANPLRFGVVLGAFFGTWNLIYSLLLPLAEDSPFALLSFYGPMFLMPGLAGFAAFRSTGRWLESMKAAVAVAVSTQVVFGIANMLRVNLLLDTLRQRSDWQNLVSRFEQSDFESFRSYVNYDYAMQTVPKLVAVSLIAAVCGLFGGMFAAAFRARLRTN